MSAGTAFAPRPMRLSNRALIRQMESWGWHVRRVHGEWTEMQNPIGERIDVRSAHTHVGNAPLTYQEVLERTGDRLSWNQFMRPITEESEVIAEILRRCEGREDFLEAVDEMVRVAEEAEQQLQARKDESAERERRRQRDQKSRKKRARKAAATQQREDTPVNAAPTPTPPEPEGYVVKNRGMADRVFAVILNRSGPITNAQIAEELELDWDENKSAIGNATNYLSKLGVIDRVKRGVWQRKHQYSAHDVTIDVVSRNLDSIPVEIRPHQPTPEAEPVREKVREIHADRRFLNEDRDELLNDLLDLMFPDGFKAKHLRSIEQWKQATVALIDSIEED